MRPARCQWCSSPRPEHSGPGKWLKKTHLSLKKPYFSWDRLRHTVAAKSTVSCRSWAKVSFTTFDPCWQPGNNATNSNISCNLAIICYNIALILPVSNS
jgi:hypothetical protein